VRRGRKKWRKVKEKERNERAKIKGKLKLKEMGKNKHRKGVWEVGK
jgi:hypothetical protein